MSTKQKQSRIQGGGAWSGSNKRDGGSSTSVVAARTSSTPKATYIRQQKPKYTILQPGLVHLPGAIDWDTQKWLIDLCFSFGKRTSSDSEGFYEEKNGVMVLNQGTRGRMIKPVESFGGARLRALTMKVLNDAMTVDPTLPHMDPNTVLINFYNEKASFKWHRDSEDPNLILSKQGRPIVSFSVGQSATFSYKYSYEETTHQNVRLDSGDVLIFGGPSRMIVHSVTQIIPKTIPPPLIGLMLSGRLNLTVRDIGSGKIDSSQFPAYRLVYDGTTTTNTEEGHGDIEEEVV